ncbi:MAG: S4 domain-containing protein, partial [Planctomycetota bacterium]
MNFLSFEAGISALNLFADAGLASSKSEARRLIQQGGGYVNKDKIPDIDFTITADHLDDNGTLMLRA